MSRAQAYTEAAERLRKRWPDATFTNAYGGVQVEHGRIVIITVPDGDGWSANARRSFRVGTGFVTGHTTPEAACDAALRAMAEDVDRHARDAEAEARAVAAQVQTLIGASVDTTGRAAADGGNQ